MKNSHINEKQTILGKEQREEYRIEMANWASPRRTGIKK